MRRSNPLDPNFALAYARLASIYSNLGEENRSLEAAKKAFDLRERVSERERFYIAGHYYSAIGDIEKEKMSEGTPSEYYLLNEATNAAASRGQLRKAEELMQRSVQATERLGFKGTTAAVVRQNIARYIINEEISFPLA